MHNFFTAYKNNVIMPFQNLNNNYNLFLFLFSEFTHWYQHTEERPHNYNAKPSKVKNFGDILHGTLFRAQCA